MLDAESAIRAELTPREKLLWAGTARTGVFFRPLDALVIPVNVFVCAIACVLFAGLMAQGGINFWIGFILITAVFVAGIYGAVGRLFVDAQRRGRTCYGVTDKRVIIAVLPDNRVVRSLYVERISDIMFRESENGAGSITFGPHSWYLEWLETTHSWPGVVGTTMARLDLASDARRVYEIILTSSQSSPSVPKRQVQSEH